MVAFFKGYGRVGMTELTASGNLSSTPPVVVSNA
jgi:hypothetical protein